MGTVSVSVVSRGATGDKLVTVADVTYSSSYATGGDTVPLASLGLQQVEAAYHQIGTLDATRQATGFTPASHGTQPVLAGTPGAPKLKVFNGSTSEVANATNLSALPAVRIEFRGH